MPSHQEKLAFIRAAAIAANPEILELKFGCKIACEQSEQHSVVTVYDGFVECEDGIDYSSYRYKIIGRPITLCDVIQTIKKAGYNSTDEWYKILGHLVDYWSINRDKGDDLNVKSEGTIDFIHAVLS